MRVLLLSFKIILALCVVAVTGMLYKVSVSQAIVAVQHDEASFHSGEERVSASESERDKREQVKPGNSRAKAGWYAAAILVAAVLIGGGIWAIRSGFLKIR